MGGATWTVVEGRSRSSGRRVGERVARRRRQGVRRARDARSSDARAVGDGGEMVRRDRKSGVVARRSARVGTEARGEASSARSRAAKRKSCWGRRPARTKTRRRRRRARRRKREAITDGMSAKTRPSPRRRTRVCASSTTVTCSWAAPVLCSPASASRRRDGKLEIVFAVSYYFDAHVRFDGDVDPSKYAASGLVILDGESLVTKR